MTETRFAGSFNDFFIKNRNNREPVKCGTCSACCKLPGLYVSLQPHEAKSGRFPIIPAEMINAPGGFWLQKMDVSPEDPKWGSCPLVCSEGCSIYQDRPAGCGAFDCRLFEPLSIRPSWWSDTIPRWNFLLGRGDDLKLWALMFLANLIDTGAGREGLEVPTDEATDQAKPLIAGFIKAMIRAKVVPTQTVMPDAQADEIRLIALELMEV